MQFKLFKDLKKSERKTDFSGITNLTIKNKELKMYEIIILKIVSFGNHFD